MDNNETTTIEEQNENTPNLRAINIVDEMKSSYINYAMSVIVSRALPDVKDGLKPVQRRILYSMFKLGIHAGRPYKKSARTVGDVIAKYHPHGDTSVYDAMARLAQDFNTRYLLVDGQGNFGSIDGDPPAAMRYTESRIHKLGMELLAGLEKETVDYTANYDGTTKEPSVLPANFPNLLVNGAEGIAVGMATKIPPHNLGEVIDALIAMIEEGNKWNGLAEWKWNADPFEKYKEEIKEAAEGEITASKEGIFPLFETDLTAKELMKYVKGPDFPTGGSIYDAAESEAMYSSGKGRILMRAEASIEELKNGRFQIIVTQVPYQVNKARLVAKIADLVRDKKIVGISDLRDESAREGIRIAIDLKKDAKPKTVLNKLYKYTEMQKAFNANVLALVNGEPKVLTLARILELYVTHRQEVTLRATYYDLVKAKEREHILEGLMIALANLDEVIKTIRESKTQEEAKTNLMKKFKLSEIQSQAILDMQLRRLAALERLKIEQEYKEIQALIKELESIMSSPAKVLDIIKTQLVEVKEKYADKRRTKVYKGKVDEISEEDLVAKEDTIVTISEKGYIKRMLPNIYETQHRGGKGKIGMTTKEGDTVSHVFVCSTHDDILFFTNKGRAFQIKVYDIPESSRTAKGQAVANLINVEQGELVTSVLTKSGNSVIGEDVKQEKEEKKEKQGQKYKYLFFATKNGTVKKTALAEFEKIRSNGLISINLEDDDELRWVKPTTGESEILLVTSHARSIRFKEKDVRPTGRATMGVRGIKFRDAADEVIAMDVVREGELFVMSVSENGYGKKTKLEQFPMQGRGGQGVFAFQLRTKTGNLVSSRVIDHPTSELLMMSEEGNAIRLKVEDLPELNRQTSGVRLIKLKSSDKVAAVAFL